MSCPGSFRLAALGGNSSVRRSYRQTQASCKPTIPDQPTALQAVLDKGGGARGAVGGPEGALAGGNEQAEAGEHLGAVLADGAGAVAADQRLHAGPGALDRFSRRGAAESP